MEACGLQSVAMLGDVFVDMQADGVSGLPEWGKDRTTSSVRIIPGGACANTARQLACLAIGSLKVSLFSTLGDDELGRLFLRHVRDERLLQTPEETLRLLPGVAQSCCIILSGMASAADAPASAQVADRAMVSCYSSTSRLSVSECTPALRQGGGWAALHLGGYFNCPRLHTDELLSLCSSVRAGGGIVSFDPQYDASERWEGEGGHLRKLLPLLDVLLPSENEAMGISSQPSPEAALAQLASQYPKMLVVVKLGEHGCIAARGSQRWAQPAFATRVVDATGAGDAFNAGFLSRYVSDCSDVEAALRAGAAAGAVAVSRSGACERPINAHELSAFL